MIIESPEEVALKKEIEILKAKLSYYEKQIGDYQALGCRRCVEDEWWTEEAECRPSL